MGLDILAWVLMVQVAAFPGMPPIHVDRFIGEKECRAAAKELDSSTRIKLVLRCEVDT